MMLLALLAIPCTCLRKGKSERAPELFKANMVEVNQQKRNFPGDHANVKIGLALSGGGTRAVGWGLGVLRALENMGLMSKFDAISTVSGGTWIGAPYMFQTKYTLDELFGPKTDPGKLTEEELNKASARMNDMSSDPTTAKLALYAAIFPHDRVWEKMITDVILNDFNLGVRENMYMAASDEHRSDIIRRNPQLRKWQFHIPAPNRAKVFIMNGIITAPTDYTTNFDNAVPFEMSPDYTGTPTWPNYTRGEAQPMHYTSHKGKTPADLIMGGGFIESFAHGAKEPSEQSRSGEVTLEKVNGRSLSLSSAVAISSAPLFRPKRYSWPVTPEGKTQKAVEFDYADGGICENSGLLPLLARRARKVVQVVASDKGLATSIDWCKDRSEEEWQEIHGTCADSACLVSSFFGYKARAFLNNKVRNLVFPRERAQPFFCRLQTLKRSGKPAVFTETFPVLENQWYGIEGGYDVEVLFVILEKSSEFEEKLPSSTQEMLKSKEDYKNHPYYHVYSEEIDVFWLKRPLSNLLAAQSEYSVMQNQNLVRNFLN